MKKVIVAVIFTALSLTGLFAGNGYVVSLNAVKAFEQEYADATDVAWKLKEGYVVASFLLNSKRVEALYDDTGEKIGALTYFNVEKLPIHIKRRLASKYSGYSINESIEFKGETETAYFICAANDEKLVYLKIVDGAMQVIKVVRKQDLPSS